MNLSYQIWVGFIFVYQKSLKWVLKTCFWVQNHLLNLCSNALNSKGYCLIKKLVWKVCINLSVIWIYVNYQNQINSKEGLYIRNLKYAHLTSVFWQNNIHLISYTCQHKYTWVLCTGKPVLNASFKISDE